MSPAMSLHSQTLSASGGIPHGRMIVHPVVNGHMAAAQAAARTSPPTITIGQKIAQLNEAVWMQIGGWPVPFPRAIQPHCANLSL